MLNRVRLIGFLGADPETLKTRTGGADYARFTLATSERWRDKNTGERREATEWHKIVVWNEKLVELVRKYLKKGSKIYLEGKLTTRKWQGRDGVDRWTTEIVLQGFGSQLVLLDKREGDRPPEPEQPYGFGADEYSAAKDGELALPDGGAGQASGVHEGLDDEIPF